MTTVAPLPLVPGCYIAAIGEEIRFLVRDDGAVEDRGP